MSAAPERVLVLCTDRGIPVHGPSGASAHLRGVARALSDRGLDVRVATPLDHDHRGRWDAPLGVLAVHRTPRRWPRRIDGLGRLVDGRSLGAAATHGWRPDWIWERHTLHSDAGLRLSRHLGVPRLVELNAPLVRERDLVDPVRHRTLVAALERRSLRTADRVVAVSGWLERWAVDSVGVPAERVVHVCNGVQPQPVGDRAATRRRLGLGDELLVGFVGSLKPWHGVDRLAGILDALGADAMGLCVGSGPGPAPRHPRLRLIPQVEPRALPDLVAAMDVGIAPYPTDAPPWFCPLKLLQYRAQGVPVVATDLGDCARLVGDAGLLVDTDAAAAWASTIRLAAELPRQPWIRSWATVVDEALSRWPRPR
jgi:glycosyltransferase involved in cell wall biosynthesis